MSRPDFNKLAEEWVYHLEQEYWGETRCRCKEMLMELLKEMYEAGRRDR